MPLALAESLDSAEHPRYRAAPGMAPKSGLGYIFP
jgi:hypothetical protein